MTTLCESCKLSAKSFGICSVFWDGLVTLQRMQMRGAIVWKCVGYQPKVRRAGGASG